MRPAQNRARPQLQVLLVGPVPPPEGGVATAVAELVEASRGQCELSLFDSSAHASVGQAGLWRVRNVLRAMRLAVMLRRTVRQQRPAVVQVESGGYLGLLKSAALTLGARPAPVILSVHSPFLSRDLDMATPPGRYLIRLALRRVAAVRVEHEGQAQELARLVPDLSRDSIRVIPNLVRADEPRPRAIDSEPAPLLLSVGSVGRRKGTYELLEALGRLRARRPAFRCTVIGPEERTGELAALSQVARDLGLNDVVTFEGEVDRANISKRMRQATVFVLPTRAEGLPLAVLEAMAAGLPLAVTNVGGLGEAVRQPRVPLLEPGDVAGLAATLEKLITDPDLRAACTEANRRQLLERYSAEAVIGQFLELWTGVAEGTGP